MYKQRVHERRIAVKRKNKIRTNYNDILEIIEKEYKWETAELDRVREMHKQVQKMYWDKDSRLGKYIIKLFTNNLMKHKTNNR